MTMDDFGIEHTRRAGDSAALAPRGSPTLRRVAKERRRLLIKWGRKER